VRNARTTEAATTTKKKKKAIDPDDRCIHTFSMGSLRLEPTPQKEGEEDEYEEEDERR